MGVNNALTPTHCQKPTHKSQRRQRVCVSATVQCKAKFIKQNKMEKKDLYKLTVEELLVEKEKMRKSKLFHAISIGFLAGILIFGVVSWGLSSEKRLGFIIPMLIPVVFIYRLLKNPNRNKDLEDVLKERGLR